MDDFYYSYTKNNEMAAHSSGCFASKNFLEVSCLQNGLLMKPQKIAATSTP